MERYILERLQYHFLQVGITTEIVYVQINVEINTVIIQKQFFKNDPEIPVITK